MTALMTTTLVFVIINIVLILGLMAVYAKNLKKIQSAFTWGLFTFASLFLLHNLVCLYYFITMMPEYIYHTEVFTLIITLLQTVAFGLLNWITWK